MQFYFVFTVLFAFSISSIVLAADVLRLTPYSRQTNKYMECFYDCSHYLIHEFEKPSVLNLNKLLNKYRKLASNGHCT